MKEIENTKDRSERAKHIEEELAYYSELSKMNNTVFREIFTWDELNDTLRYLGYSSEKIIRIRTELKQSTGK